MKGLIKFIPAAVGGIAGKAGAGKGLIGAGAAMVAARIARKSVPGALLVGGALAAKWLYDQKQASPEGQAKAEPTPPPATPESPPPARRASGRSA